VCVKKEAEQMPEYMNNAFCVLACRISGALSILLGGMFVGFSISGANLTLITTDQVLSIVLSLGMGAVMAGAGSLLISPSGTRYVAKLVRGGNFWSHLAHLPVALGAITAVLGAAFVYYKKTDVIFSANGLLFVALVIAGLFFSYCFFSLTRFFSYLRHQDDFMDNYEPGPEEGSAAV
jgi:hypothetical protein